MVNDQVVENHLAQLWNMLGDKITVIVDRPLGSTHPKHRDIVYEVNYGYVPGTVAPDGCEIDAYILGVDRPIQSFYGKCIAFIERTNDVEGKLIVVPFACVLSDQEILSRVEFQERYFNTILRRR